MTIPPTTPPARPVTDALIATDWGTWAHDWVVYLASGHPRVRCWRSTDQGLANNTAEPLLFNTDEFDVGPMHNPVTNNGRITIPDPGLYAIGGACRFAANGAGSRQLYIRLNGSTTLAHTSAAAPDTAGLTTDLEVFVSRQLNAGDYLELMAWQDSGTTLNAKTMMGSAPMFWAEWRATNATVAAARPADDLDLEGEP